MAHSSEFENIMVREEEHSKVNVLVATDVVKEDIDVRNCSCVIRFERSFIQLRGRVSQNKSNQINSKITCKYKS